MTEGDDRSGRQTGTDFGRLLEGVADADVFDRERSRNRVTAALLGGPSEASKIGPFFVLERLGEGGMGVVYAGFDPRLGRKVAIKVLHAGHGDSRHGSAEGILREARALARLSHPNTVSVHEVGTHNGGVYLAMEFVDGMTLAQWLAKRPRPWSEILEIVVAAGRGLQAAHEAGLVHRDFKPDNVLIGSDDQVRVADFGLARGEQAASPTEPSLPTADVSIDRLTETGAVVGTPRYMAPEQHLGEAVGPAADQYALCLTLAEGIVGRFPLAQTLLALVQQKVDGAQPRLEVDAVGDKVPAWLQRAIGRGLQPAARDRFESMATLLAALRPPRRGSATVWGGALVVAGLGVGAGLLMRPPPASPAATATGCPDFAPEIEAQWSPAKRAAVAAAVRATGAPGATELARPALDRLDRHVEAWVDARGQLCRLEMDRLESAAVLGRREECLHQGRVVLAATVDVLLDPASEQVARMGSIVGALRPPKDCLAASLPQIRRYVRVDPEQRERRDEGVAAVAAVDALIAAGRYEDARGRLDALNASYGISADEDPMLAMRYHTAQAKVRSGDERIDHGYAALQAATIGNAPGDVMEAYFELANRLFDEKRFDEERRVLDLGRAEVKAYERVAVTEWGRTLVRIATAKFATLEGDLLREQGETAAAIEAFERALELLRDAPGRDVAVLRVLNNLAEVYRVNGRYDEALNLYERAIAIARETLGDNHPDVATMLNNRGSVAFDTGHLDVAKTELSRALAVAVATTGTSGEAVGLTRFNLGMIAYTYGQLPEARRQLEAAREVWGEGGMRTAAYRHVAVAALASVAHHEGDDDEAMRLHDASVAALRTMITGPHPVLAQVIAERGTTLLEIGRTREAKVDTSEALAMFEQSFGIETFGAAAVMTLDAHASLLLGDAEVAEATYRRAKAIVDELGNELHPGLASVHAGLAETARRRGDAAQARMHRTRVAAIEAAHPGLLNWASTGLR